MKEKTLNIIKFIISIGMFFFLSNLISGILRRLGIDINIFDYTDYGYLDTLVELIFALIVYILYRKYFNKDYNEFENNFKNNINDIFKFFAIFFVLKIISSVVTSIIGYIFDMNILESENQNIIVKITEKTPILMLISTVILAPIVEEGIFRLGLRKIIKNDYLFILISGLVFGFMHIFPTDLSMSIALTYSITYVTMGFYLAYIYVEKDNIWINILIHSLNNLISMIAILMFY